MLPPRFARLKPDERTLVQEGIAPGPALDSLRAMARALLRLESNAGDVFDRLRESVLVGGLVRGEHFRGRLLTARLTAPSPWVPLTLVPPFVQYPSGSFPTPAWMDYLAGSTVRVRLQGILSHGGIPAPPFGTVIATALPKPTWQARHTVDGNGAHGLVETLANATLTYGFGDVGLLSLEGVDYETAAPLSDWAAPVDVPLPNDFPGTVDTVEVLGAREAGSDALVTENTPGVSGVRVAWTVVPVGTGRALRIRRVDGLAPGVTYELAFWLAGK